MTAQQIVDRHLGRMIFMTILLSLTVIGIMHCFKKEIHVEQAPSLKVNAVLYKSHDNAGNIIYQNKDYSCEIICKVN